MAEQNSNKVVVLISLVIAIISLVMIIVVFTSLPPQPEAELVKDARKLAGELSDNNLPAAAIEEYRRILSQSALTKPERGAVNYLIGRTYFEDVGDYEQAASYYIRARALDANASYATEAGRNLITCLERLGRSSDARRELESQASIEPDTSTGKLVAVVGSEKITVTEFNRAYDMLPDEAQAMYSSESGKKEFLNQLVGRELIYHAALREGFDHETEVRQAMKGIEKDYLVQYYSQRKIAPTVKPDTASLNLYYNANKANYGDKPFDEVKQKVSQDYMTYLGQKTIREYMDGLLQVEKVQTFEENLR